MIAFLEKSPAVKTFLKHVQGLLDLMIPNYLERNFTDIMVAFGCTGGQHRSVYCANQLAQYISQKYAHKKVEVELRHRELEMKQEA